MCKIRLFCTLPKGFVGGAPAHLIEHARAMVCESSLIALGRVETKGFLMSSATEHALAFVYKRSFSDGT